jgi:hypothetical protein
VAQISIPGAQGSTLTFTITGNAASNLASDFARSVMGAPATTTLSSGSPQSTMAGALNIINASGTTQYSLTTGGQYTFASVGSATQITGSTVGGDTVVAGGGVTYTAGAGHDRVGFFAGNNLFDGGITSGNTITGGGGNDTINAGTGRATIFGGTGNAVVNLADSSAGAGDVVVLQGGNSTVNASGAADTVFASSSATINGGSSVLTFVSTTDPGTHAAPAADTIVSGTSGAHIFGIAGTDIVLQGTSAAGMSVFVAGAGNETLNAAGAAGPVAFFANAVAADSASVNESVTGGSGTNVFLTGTGAEYFQGGPGTNFFDLASVAGGQVTIAGFSASDFVAIQGLNAAEAGSVLSNGTVSGGNLTVSLSDGTRIEFVGVTSLSGHVV